jgi:hypothetical protein
MRGRMHGSGTSRTPSYKSATRRAADNANYADAGTISSARDGKPSYAQYAQADRCEGGVEAPQQRMYLDGEWLGVACMSCAEVLACSCMHARVASEHTAFRVQSVARCCLSVIIQKNLCDEWRNHGAMRSNMARNLCAGPSSSVSAPSLLRLRICMQLGEACSKRGSKGRQRFAGKTTYAP